MGAEFEGVGQAATVNVFKVTEREGVQQGAGSIDVVCVINGVDGEGSIGIHTRERVEGGCAADDEVHIVELEANGGMWLDNNDSIHVTHLGTQIAILAAQANQLHVAGCGVPAVIQSITACPAID